MPGPSNKYPVELTPQQCADLRHLLRAGRAPAQKLTHARILLKAHQNWSNERIAQSVDVSPVTVWRIRKRFCEAGLEAALVHKPFPKRKPRLMDGRAEAHLIALACGPPPQGHARWTLHLLAGKLVELHVVPAVSYETVRRVLKKKSARAPRQKALVHSAQAERRLRRRDGRCAGCL